MSSPTHLASNRPGIERCLMPRLDCVSYLSDREYRREIKGFLERGVGGFVLFTGAVEDVRSVTQQLQQVARYPLLLAADCEYGTAMRFEGGTEFPPMMGLGSCGEPELVGEIGRAIGLEMSAIGLNWSLGPVLDINSNSANPIVNVRSFGESAQLVADMGRCYAEGLRSAGVLNAGKHWPGHGNTTVDSHIALPVVSQTREQLATLELQPFEELVRAGVDALMTAHLNVTSLADDGLPVSLSRAGIAFLRQYHRYAGPLITDALDMGALDDILSSDACTRVYGTVDDISVAAFLAGNDLLELPPDPRASLEALRESVASGKISTRRLSESLERVSWLSNRARALGARDNDRLPLPEVRSQNRTLARKAFSSVVKVEGKPVPLLQELGSWYIFYGPADSQNRSRLLHHLSTWMELDPDADGQLSGGKIREGSRGMPPVVIFLYSPRGGAGRVVLDDEESTRLEQIGSAPPIEVFFGNPYIETGLAARSRINAYSSAEMALDVVREIVLGHRASS